MRSLYNIVFFIIFFSWIHGNKIAVTTKVKGLVEIMPIGDDNFANLKPGTILSDGFLYFSKHLQKLFLYQELF